MEKEQNIGMQSTGDIAYPNTIAHFARIIEHKCLLFNGLVTIMYRQTASVIVNQIAVVWHT